MLSQKIANMIEMLPDNDKHYELIKRLVLAWDSDFTKLTPLERQQLEKTEKDFINGDTVSHDDINWD